MIKNENDTTKWTAEWQISIKSYHDLLWYEERPDFDSHSQLCVPSFYHYSACLASHH